MRKISKIFLLFFLVLTIPANTFSSALISNFKYDTSNKEQTQKIIVELEDKCISEINASSEYSLMSVSEENLYEDIISSHNSVVSEIENTLSYDVEIKYSYTHALNGFCIEASLDDVEKIKSIENVKRAYPEPLFYIPETELLSKTTDLLSETVTETKKGEGTAIAIIDSEFDVNHKDFVLTDESTAKFTKSDIKTIMESETLNLESELNATSVNRVFKNAKIPFAYDYADNDSDTWNSSLVHGTHVAGIAAANGNKQGVAPEAQLILMKVAKDGNSIMYGSDILAAIDDSVKLGVDTINMSLGDVAGFSQNDTAAYEIFENVRNSGISICVSAGNSGRINKGSKYSDVSNPLAENPDYALIGTYASIPAGIAVASSWSEGIESYSAWGATTSLSIGPSVTARGTGIASTLPDDIYGWMSGTSMSSPKIAATMAIVKKHVTDTYTELTPFEAELLAEQLVMSTADIIKSEDIPYSPRAQGSGEANLESATSSPAVLYAENYRPKVELGDDITNNFTFSFTLKNISDTALEYTPSAVIFTDNYTYNEEYGKYFTEITSKLLENAEVSFDCGETVTVEANSTTLITAEVTLSETDTNSLSEIFTSGFFVDGYITLTPTGTDIPALNLAISGFYGNWNTPEVFDKAAGDENSYYNLTGPVMYNYLICGTNIMNDVHYSDKVYVNPYNADYSLSLLRNAKTLKMEIKNSLGSSVSSYETEYAKKCYYLSGVMENTVLPFDTDYNWQEGEKYTAYFTATPDFEGASEQTFSSSFIVDTTAPEIISTERYTDGEKTYMRVTASDETYLQGIEIDAQGTDYYIFEPTIYEEKGKTVTVDVDVTEYKDYLLSVYAYDYAYNEAVFHEEEPHTCYVAFYTEENKIEQVLINNSRVETENNISDIIEQNKTLKTKYVKVFSWDENQAPTKDLTIYTQTWIIN